MKQTTLPQTWVPGTESSSSSESSSSEEEVKRPRSKPLLWTRVKSLELIKKQKVMVYQAAEDLKFDKTLKIIRKELEHDRGEFVFDPDHFKDVSKTFDIESFRLPKEGLLEYARVASRLRNLFKEKAIAAKANQVAIGLPDEEEKDFVHPKLYRSHDRNKPSKDPTDLMLGFEAGYASRKNKKRKKHELNL